MTLEEQAAEVWRAIRSNLEDRSVLHIDCDEELAAELVAEQIEVISSAFRPVQEPHSR